MAKTEIEPFIELSVRVSDGRFEGKLSVPVACTNEQWVGFAKMSIEMLANVCQLIPERQKESIDE